MAAISGELVIQIIRNAFMPLHCSAEMYDYDNALRLNIVDDTNTSLLKLSGITSDQFGDTDQLRTLLEQLREDLAHHKGAQLAPWQMPELKVIAT